MLQRPRIAPKIEPAFFERLRDMLTAAELVTITEHVAACRDPDDDMFLELAVNGNADVIISGDADLLALDTSWYPDHHSGRFRTHPGAISPAAEDIRRFQSDGWRASFTLHQAWTRSPRKGRSRRALRFAAQRNPKRVIYKQSAGSQSCHGAQMEPAASIRPDVTVLDELEAQAWRERIPDSGPLAWPGTWTPRARAAMINEWRSHISRRSRRLPDR